MAPNATYKLIGTMQIALPYDQPNYTKLGGAGNLEEPSAVYHPGSLPRGQETADDNEDESVVRITTRARTTYALDRFNKHAMLIISDINTNKRNSKNSGTIIYLKHTFQRYKFEVTIIESKESNQTHRNDAGKRIDQFFQQDFSEIGATAVVMSTSSRRFPIVTKADGVEERDLLKYFIDHPALEGKPKIFITEARDSAFHDALLVTERVNADEIRESFGAGGLPDDVLLIQAKMVHNDEHCRPLDFLCHTLNTINDRSNLHDMLLKLYQKVSKRFPRHRAPITYHSTLTKELVMDKLDVNNYTAAIVIDWMDLVINQKLHGFITASTN